MHILWCGPVSRQPLEFDWFETALLRGTENTPQQLHVLSFLAIRLQVSCAPFQYFNSMPLNVNPLKECLDHHKTQKLCSEAQTNEIHFVH